MEGLKWSRRTSAWKARQSSRDNESPRGNQTIWSPPTFSSIKRATSRKHTVSGLDIEPIIDGLQVSGIGMGMTTAVLIILALSVRAVSWADAVIRRREAERAANKEVASETAEISEAPTLQDDKDGPARAAAIAVALALSQREHEDLAADQQTAEGVPANAAHDTWLAEGRARQHARHGGTTRTRDRR